MKLVVDCTSIRVGGGVEQTNAFLKGFSNLCLEFDIAVTVVVRKKNAFEGLPSIFREIKIGDSRFSKVVFLLFGWALLRRDRPDLVYVPFGVGLWVPRNVPQVINFAYPILCYPDSPYWRHLPIGRWCVNQIKSKIRSFLIRNFASCVIVESEIMSERLVKYLNLPSKNVRVIPPGFGGTAQELQKNGDMVRSQTPLVRSVTKFVFIAGPDLHKNLWRLPELAAQLCVREFRNYEFRLTLSELEFVELCRVMGVSTAKEALISNGFIFLGRLSGANLLREIKEADVLVNLSDLESVSNNFIEASCSSKPMIVAKRDFGVYCIQTPHLFCEPHNSASLLRAFKRAIAGDFESIRVVNEIAISSDKRSLALLELFSEVSHVEVIPKRNL